LEESVDELRAIHHPHDTLFRSVFADPELAAELLRAELPEAIAQAIDSRSLRPVEGSFVDDSLATHEADLLFEAQTNGEPVLFYVLLEHKAEEDPFTAFQLLRYIVRILERFRREHPDAQSLPMIVPLVIHHGRRPWRGATDLAALLQTERLPAEFAARQVALRFQVMDLAREDTDLHARGLKVHALLPLLHMQWLRRVADTVALLRSWNALYRALLVTPGGLDIARRLVSYVAAVSDRPTTKLRHAFRQIHPVMEEHYMSTADQILNQGVQKGTARTVLQLLERRFGRLDAETSARVNDASLEELETIAARLLDAPTLAAVFGS